MSESSMVCNGHKENSVEKSSAISVNELFSSEKSVGASTSIAANSSKDSMTIGTIPFPDFDHLYASNLEETGEHSSLSMNVARSNLSSYHLNIIEEQAKIIDTQNHEIAKLKKQNDSLMARIERMNRRLSLNQCNKKIPCREKQPRCSDEKQMKDETSNVIDKFNNQETQDDSFPDDVPLICLTPYNDATEITKSNSACADFEIETSKITMDNTQFVESELEPQKFINQNLTPNFRLKFRTNNTAFTNQRQKRSKIVRFVEEKYTSAGYLEKPKRNCAKTIDEKLKNDDAVFFLKTIADETTKIDLPEPLRIRDFETSDGQFTRKKSILKIPILSSNETYFTSVKENTSHLYDPITYTPTALEVPSFRTVEKDNVESSDVPKDYYEDVTIEAAKERHSRFEVGERKRKKWDVQRIRELRQNERLKEKLRRRKSRWNKLELPKQSKNETSEMITSLFPNVRTIEKIIITDIVPVTALGTSIPKIPSWGCSFKTNWMNDGNVDSEVFEDQLSHNFSHQHHHHNHNHHQNHHQQKDSKSKPA